MYTSTHTHTKRKNIYIYMCVCVCIYIYIWNQLSSKTMIPLISIISSIQLSMENGYFLVLYIIYVYRTKTLTIYKLTLLKLNIVNRNKKSVTIQIILSSFDFFFCLFWSVCNFRLGNRISEFNTPPPKKRKETSPQTIE